MSVLRKELAQAGFQGGVGRVGQSGVLGQKGLGGGLGLLQQPDIYAQIGHMKLR